MTGGKSTRVLEGRSKSPEMHHRRHQTLKVHNTQQNPRENIDKGSEICFHNSKIASKVFLRGEVLFDFPVYFSKVLHAHRFHSLPGMLKLQPNLIGFVARQIKQRSNCV